MAYRANPFLERRSEENTTSDQEFVRFFSPKVLEHLPQNIFDGAVHVFRSPPGGGKTTILRAFTPTALRAFWYAKKAPEMAETFQRLVAQGVLDESSGPLLLGVKLSCASGYADLPPGALFTNDGIFRALVDCRVVLRSLRSLAALIGASDAEQLSEITLSYREGAKDLKSIPLLTSTTELLEWAEKRERSVYAQLDSFGGAVADDWPSHVRFEGLLWLQEVQFKFRGKTVGDRRLLMVDDMHKLRRKQRKVLIEEMVELRPAIPVWLAERNVALGTALLAQGVREGRDLREHSLDELWGAGKGQQSFFLSFAQNILDRRLTQQVAIPPGSFGQYLGFELQTEDVVEKLAEGIAFINELFAKYRSNPQYSEWLQSADRYASYPSLESLREMFLILIHISRNEGKRQTSLALGPLPVVGLEEKDSSKDEGAADIFMHEFAGLPYFFGLDRLCLMATNNVEELLGLAAMLYEGIKARQILRKDLVLSPIEQERILCDAAKKKRSFIPKSHTVGNNAQKMIDGIGAFCRSRTFELNAPYAPGVTGVRLTNSRMRELEEAAATGQLKERETLLRVLSECVAENLLVKRPSAASTAREAGVVFYLNRTLCAAYGLPLQTGGWQDVAIDDLLQWMARGPVSSKQARIALR